MIGVVLTGRGLGGLAEAAAQAPAAEQTDYFAIVTSAAALGLAGLLFALLTMARLAPLGPGLAGLGYLAIGVWALADRDNLLATVPAGLVGLDEDRLTAATTVAPLLAVPLLVTVFIPRRWPIPLLPPGRPAPAPPPAGDVPARPAAGAGPPR